jgi:hypothetical protein
MVTPSTSRTLGIAMIIAAGHLAGCEGKERARPSTQAPPAAHSCLNVTVGQNSRGTIEVFERRSLQGGGPTWAALLKVFVQRHTTTIAETHAYRAGMPGFGVPFVARYRGGETWFILDEEGDGAILCSGTVDLLNDVRAEYERANSDQLELERALNEVDASELE